MLQVVFGTYMSLPEMEPHPYFDRKKQIGRWTVPTSHGGFSSEMVIALSLVQKIYGHSIVSLQVSSIILCIFGTPIPNPLENDPILTWPNHFPSCFPEKPNLIERSIITQMRWSMGLDDLPIFMISLWFRWKKYVQLQLLRISWFLQCASDCNGRLCTEFFALWERSANVFWANHGTVILLMVQKSGYPPVDKHSNGKSPFWIGNTSSNGRFSIAMLDYRSVTSWGW